MWSMGSGFWIFLVDRDAGGGAAGSLLGLEAVGTRQKEKSKKMTCAESWGRRCKRPSAHAKKKKQENDVCGEAGSAMKEAAGTCQKEKSKKFSRKSRKGTKYIIQQVT